MARRTGALRYDMNPQVHEDWLSSLLALNGSNGLNISYLAQSSILEVVGDRGDSRWFSLIHHDVYQNKTRLLTESEVRTPERDSLMIASGIISPYPNALFRVGAADMPGFVESVRQLSSAADYRVLMDRYGIRRTHRDFWSYSDRLHDYYRQSAGIEYGLLDYNRLENR